jgi:hypothetical protein
VGGTETLTATVTPDDARNQNVKWTSSNAAIATVTDGTVTAVAVGIATITVTTVDGNHTATCTVNVITINEEDFGTGADITTINVANIDQWNEAASTISSGGNNRNYVITIPADVEIPLAGSTNPSFPDSTFGNATGITVSLRGDGTLTLTGTTGYLIGIGANQTVILRELTLKGNESGLTGSLVGVGIQGTFTMHSGKISGNKVNGYGGGAYVNQGIFTMNGGKISGNTASSGGGVYLNTGRLTMNGGEISGNTANGAYGDGGGGGVYLNGVYLRLVTGTIYGSGEVTGLKNTASSGAALYVGSGGGTAQHGTFAANGTTWNSSGNLATTDDTIRAVNGELQ